MTFSLAGFNTVRREGIELTGNFTATVNADLKVGALEETITVSGASPTVDVQSLTNQTVFTREMLDVLPADVRLRIEAADEDRQALGAIPMLQAGDKTAGVPDRRELLVGDDDQLREVGDGLRRPEPRPGQVEHHIAV